MRRSGRTSPCSPTSGPGSSWRGASPRAPARRRSSSPITVSSPGATPGRSRTPRCSGCVARARVFLGPAAAAPPGPDAGGVERLLPQLRGRLSRQGRRVLAVDRGQRPLADRPDVAAIAAARSTPDHMLRIGGRTCVLPPDADVAVAIDAFETSRRAVDERFAPAESSPLRTHLPQVLLVPGLGAVAAAADAEAAAVALELAAHSHATTAATLDRFGGLSWLDDEQVAAFEHWPLELDRLSLARRRRSSPGPSSSSPARPRASAARWRSTSPARRAPGARRRRRSRARRDRVTDRPGACDRGARRPDRTAGRRPPRRGRSWRRTAASTPPCSAPASRRRACSRRSPTRSGERSLDVNLTAPFLLTRRLWPVLERAGPRRQPRLRLVQERLRARGGLRAVLGREGRPRPAGADRRARGRRRRDPRQRRQPGRRVRRLEAVVGGGAPAPRRGARRPGRGARALLRLAEPARPGGDERRRRGGRRVPRLRPVAGDDGLRCHGGRRRARRLPPLAPETEAAPAPGRATLGRWPRGRER